ncbi:hypothetical protein DPMN_095313 [Dreissena polymorpha]|uniref:Uncharacterized protein n=1 Tax=Dreissena polymorpha TaxID=45954 RepID=A0A9D4R3F5_DREPO|nr:hypothetical protein DPMN_095313 [Dreissena polymorpha]
MILILLIVAEFDHESGVPVDLGDDVDGADGSDMFTTPNAEIKKETRAVSKTPKQKTGTIKLL